MALPAGCSLKHRKINLKIDHLYSAPLDWNGVFIMELFTGYNIGSFMFLKNNFVVFNRGNHTLSRVFLLEYSWVYVGARTQRAARSSAENEDFLFRPDFLTVISEKISIICETNFLFSLWSTLKLKRRFYFAAVKGWLVGISTGLFKFASQIT